MFVEICLYPGDVAYEDDNDKDDIIIIMISWYHYYKDIMISLL